MSTYDLQALLAKARERAAASAVVTPSVHPNTAAHAVVTAVSAAEGSDETGRHFINQYGELIYYNEEQSRIIDIALSGQSCVLLGAAGTGKTTCMRGLVEELSRQPRIPQLRDVVHKYLPSCGVPGIMLVSFTRRAVANLKRAMPEHMRANCITIHKALEYEPHYYEVEDPESGNSKTTMRFEPARTALNPLPYDIRVVIVDEASMVSVELEKQLRAALRPDVQFIYLGDLNQLPPVFDTAVLGYRILELPVVELTRVYRQALESPIIKYATQIRKGEIIDLRSLEKLHENNPGPHGGIATLHPWKKRISADNACLTAAKFMTTALDCGRYDPEEDMILIPYNKAFGTLELNKHIAQHITRKAGRPVHEIIAGFNKHYFSIGDKVLYDKEDAYITAISRNAQYSGKAAQEPSVHLDYWGMLDLPEDAHHISEDTSAIEDIELFLANSVAKDEDRVNQASHILTLRMCDTDREVTLNTAAELNALLLGYALTVHKAQGSEWRRVFVLLHNSHNTMVQRELLYTAITRARQELYVICESDTFIKGVQSQRIKGNTLAEKAEYFKGKLSQVA